MRADVGNVCTIKVMIWAGGPKGPMGGRNGGQGPRWDIVCLAHWAGSGPKLDIGLDCRVVGSIPGIERGTTKKGKINRYKPTDSLERWEGRVEMPCDVGGNGLNVGQMSPNVG